MAKRVGQVAVLTGLEWPAALALIPADCDRERVIALLRCFEEGMAEAGAKEAEAGAKRAEQAAAAAREAARNREG